MKKFTYARKNYTIHLESDTVRNLVPPPNLHGFPKKNDFIFTTSSGRVTRQQQRASIAFAALKTNKSSDAHAPKDSITSKPQSRPHSLKLVPVSSSGPEKRKQMAVTPYPVSLRFPALEHQCKELDVASSSFTGNANGGSNKESGTSGTSNDQKNSTKRAKNWPEDAYRVNPGDKDGAKRIGNFPANWPTNDDNVSKFTCNF